MSAKVDLVMWFQPVLGEPFTLTSAEFESVETALERLHQALADGVTVVFSAARAGRADRRARPAPTLVNFKHVLAVRIWAADADDDDAQYL